MKFYKIVNTDGHNGIVYKEGYNEDPLPFNPNANCEKGGIYFAREDILAFLDYGTELYEVEPIGEVYENPGKPKKYKAKAINLKYIGKVSSKTIEHLVEDGADIHVNEDYPIRYAARRGQLGIVKYLAERGADIHADDDYLLWLASQNGRLDIVKYLVEHGADVHTGNDYPLCIAIGYGHLDVVKYLVEQGADIHADNNRPLRLASEHGRLDIVKFLVEYGADIHVRDDYSLEIASENGHLEIVKYLGSIINDKNMIKNRRTK